MNYLNINFSLLLDPLSLFFAAVIGLVSVPSAVYAAHYFKGEYSKPKIIYGWAAFAAFIISMMLVVTAGNALFFLVAWEIMSLVSYFLVIFNSERERSVRAGTVYIIMTHIGTAFIAAAFLIIYKHSGSFDYEAMKHACISLNPHTRNFIFLLFLAGFGTKAGIVPFHVWLPIAHPEAPSHISSVMSGVMIKTAVYGIIRFIMLVLGPGPSWWSGIILVLACASCLIGIIYALTDRDLKRLLAYSSIENMGIILLGIGSSFMFIKMNMPVLAVLAMSAGLYHLLNHAVFKSLLFLCAGSVYMQAKTKNIEKLGGLIKTMPWTAAAFLIGAMGISALPPLNGFVSEWLTLQAFFIGALSLTGKAKLIMGICASVLAFTGGLAAACFVKAFAITFLAAPRSKMAEDAVESPFLMKSAMVFLALAAIILGVAAAPVIKIISKVASETIAPGMTDVNFSLNNFVLAPQGAGGAYASTPLIAAILLFTAGIAAVLLYFFYGKARKRSEAVWVCGYYNTGARAQYSATGFSKPFKLAFSFLLRPYRKTTKVEGRVYHEKPFSYEVYITPVIKKYLYEMALKVVILCANKIKNLQHGSIHIYIAYIFAAIICLIIFRGMF